MDKIADGYFIVDGRLFDRRIIDNGLHTIKECEEYAKKHGIEYHQFCEETEKKVDNGKQNG